MQSIDIILALIGLLAFITGAVRGFVRQAGAIVGLVCAILACRLFGNDVANYIMGSENSTITHVLCYAIVFVGVYLGISLIARLAQSILEAVKLGIINRLAGGIMRVIIWWVIVSVALNVYLAISPDDKDKFNDSSRPWRAATVDIAPKLMDYIAN